MKRIAIIGATGMLGSMVYRVLKDTSRLVVIYRDEAKIRLLNMRYGNIKEHTLLRMDFRDLYSDFVKGKSISNRDVLRRFVASVGDVDAVINCAGIIRPGTASDQSFTFFVNGALPHILSRIYKEKLVHVSTDCVFDGKKGAPYKETDTPTPRDIYGLSKSIGEPPEYSLVLRTSLIGPELEGQTSLLGWFLHQKGVVSGFTNHFWNGVTTKQFGTIYRSVIENRNKFPRRGLFHIFSDAHSKYEILKLLQKKYHHASTIRPTEVAESIDRRLTSVYPFCASLKIPTLAHMIEDL